MELNLNNESIDEIVNREKITITKQQRNGKKCWSLLTNFSDILENEDDIKKFIKNIKKIKCCNGSHNKGDNLIQFQGDHIDFIKDILINEFGFSSSEIEIKGI